MIELNKVDLDNILALIKRATITGEQAVTVVVLQQKLAAILQEVISKTHDVEGSTPSAPPA